MAAFKFNDEQWSDEEWKALLSRLISDGLLTWKQITTLTLGHMNPSQVGTSLASSEGFKLRYGKGNVMAKVMDWFYTQDGKCRDCGTRLELQADHNIPRESHDNPLDADYIENMVLRCRRCNVIKRPSHEFGGQTHLTAETALMWILFSFRPRTLSDFIRMCRIYGMTMADVRMQEGWAMAHWLQHNGSSNYLLDGEFSQCNILQWPDGGITRSWDADEVPDVDTATVIFERALASQHLLVVACHENGGGIVRFQAMRFRVESLPFSHYFPDEGAECLAIAYTPPKRNKASLNVDVAPDAPSASEILHDIETLDEVAVEGDLAATVGSDSGNGAQINKLPPRGMKIMATWLIDAQATASISWVQGTRTKSAALGPTARGKKLFDAVPDQATTVEFILQT
ncbi:HNH endonuclease [Dechloromonas sp. XY25]|uniref:HNH endonuclease n=1 Tax=Dechloromonas hankyongensis TaxID=2908002 RepID=A0ABS9K4L3_9RHOO|nr:HNH endonuclease [Dechloromonas hankyongensis]MCG2578085.1 HNH endonuclease [Dechloromonas hankyongensis]